MAEQIIAAVAVREMNGDGFGGFNSNQEFVGRRYRKKGVGGLRYSRIFHIGLSYGVNQYNVAALRNTQRSWLDWRLEKCDEVDEQAKCDNRVCASVAHDECIVALTTQRANELSRFKNNLSDAKFSIFSYSKKYD